MNVNLEAMAKFAAEAYERAYENYQAASRAVSAQRRLALSIQTTMMLEAEDYADKYEQLSTKFYEIYVQEHRKPATRSYRGRTIIKPFDLVSTDLSFNGMHISREPSIRAVLCIKAIIKEGFYDTRPIRIPVETGSKEYKTAWLITLTAHLFKHRTQSPEPMTVPEGETVADIVEGLQEAGANVTHRKY